jgi:hypothetical protein
MGGGFGRGAVKAEVYRGRVAFPAGRLPALPLPFGAAFSGAAFFVAFAFRFGAVAAFRVGFAGGPPLLPLAAVCGASRLDAVSS